MWNQDRLYQKRHGALTLYSMGPSRPHVVHLNSSPDTSCPYFFFLFGLFWSSDSFLLSFTLSFFLHASRSTGVLSLMSFWDSFLSDIWLDEGLIIKSLNSLWYSCLEIVQKLPLFVLTMCSCIAELQRSRNVFKHLKGDRIRTQHTLSGHFVFKLSIHLSTLLL